MTVLQDALRIAEEGRKEKRQLEKRYENVSGMVRESLRARGELAQYRAAARQAEATQLSWEEWSNRRIAKRLGITVKEAREMTREASSR